MPGEVLPTYAARVPTMRSSTTSAATTPAEMSQRVSSQVRSCVMLVRPVLSVSRAITGAAGTCRSPTPSHDSTRWVSVMQTAALPSNRRRCLALRPAASAVRP